MGNHRHNPFARKNLVGQLPTKVLDAFGRELQVGDLVVVPSVHSPHMRVADIRANLHPGAPPNTIQVALEMVLTVQVPTSTNVNQIMLVVPCPEPVEAAGEASADPMAAVVVMEPDGPPAVA